MQRCKHHWCHSNFNDPLCTMMSDDDILLREWRKRIGKKKQHAHECIDSSDNYKYYGETNFITQPMFVRAFISFVCFIFFYLSLASFSISNTNNPHNWNTKCDKMLTFEHSFCLLLKSKWRLHAKLVSLLSKYVRGNVALSQLSLLVQNTIPAIGYCSKLAYGHK